MPAAAIAAVTLALVVGIVWQFGRQEPLVAVRRSREVMGTLATLEAVGPASQEARLRQALETALARLDAVNERMSTHRQESLLSEVNRSAYDHPVVLDDWTWQVMQVAGRAFERSGGAFDPTVGPLVELWKRAGQADRLPSDEELAEAKRPVGWAKLQFEKVDGRPAVRFGEPGTRIDLGGVAKGWAVDLALQGIRSSGAVGGLVDVGGDLRTFGRPDDADRWIVAVRDPFRQGVLMELAVNDAAVCTSGNYHRFAEIRGRRYSHIIDPKTGWPADAAASVTVTGPEAAMTDALATALSVLGVADGLNVIEAMPGYEAMFVSGGPDSYRIVRSAGFRGRFLAHLTGDEPYQPGSAPAEALPTAMPTTMPAEAHVEPSDEEAHPDPARFWITEQEWEAERARLEVQMRAATQRAAPDSQIGPGEPPDTAAGRPPASPAGREARP